MEKYASASPSQVTASAIATESATPRRGRGVIWCAVAAGVTSSAKTSRAPVIWLVAATARPRRDSDQCHVRRPHGEQGGHLLAGDAEERAEEERVETVENAVVEADEE